jgi:farnesyl-diphosphate farnesyltransferase
MAIPIEIKVPILKAFHKHVYDPSWKFSCGEKDYKELMNKFELVSNAFLNLDEGYQKVIAEMTDRMGTGMAKFIESEVITVEDYDEYCHYVAGIVGLGLSRLFHASGLEAFQPDELSNSMGLFLQKTNIIRDYLEDINEIPRPRMFWPHEIWGRFATKLEDLKHEDNSENAVRCLNAMVTNALAHAIDCLKYMEAIEDEDNLRFCAIPQIMAIGTLAECYNNINVFRGVVKIRRGITAKIMLTSTMGDVYGTFFDFSTKIEKKIDDNDDSASVTRQHIEAIQEYCDSHLLEPRVFTIDQETGLDFLMILVVLMLLGFMIYMLYNNW